MGFFSNYYSGKPGQGDFTANKLPKTRVELFFAVVKDHWAALIGLNMLYFVIWLPLLAWLFVNYVYLLHLLEGGMPAYSEVMAQFMLFFLGAVPCITITGPFTAGYSYIMRNWARDEHVFVWSDMWDAIRSNWKQALPVSFLSGLLPLCTFASVYVYGVLVTTQSVLLIIPICVVGIGQLIWLLMLETVYTLMVTYDLRFRDLLKDAFFLSMTGLGKSLGLRIITCVIPVAAMVVALTNSVLSPYAIFVALGYYFLFGLSFTRLAYASYGNMLCEKYLNPHIEGADTNIGLRPEDDTEYRDEDDE